MTIILACNRVYKGELALVKNTYWGTWSRLLYAHNGTYVEVDLSPCQPERKLNWEKTKNVNIRRHCTAPAARCTKHYLSVQNGSIIFNQMLEFITPHLTQEKIAELLFRDFLPEIDWALHAKYNHAGAFFADCKKDQT